MIEQETEIIFNRQVASETFLMGLRSPEIVAEARPGQFVMIRVRSDVDPLLRRPFSICGTQGDDLFLVLYRVVGRGTLIMSRAIKGDRFSVLGPLGTGFEIPENGRKPILVSGGIGIAPLIFLARKMKGKDVIFMTGYGSAKEIVSLEWADLAGIETDVSTDDGTAGHQGVITDILEAHISGSDKGITTVFSCGPLPMLKKVAAMTLEQGIPCRVSMETHMACGLGACQGCAVKSSSQENRTYFHVCQDGPVFDARSLDWKSL